jgi:hypothetical protein
VNCNLCRRFGREVMLFRRKDIFSYFPRQSRTSERRIHVVAWNGIRRHKSWGKKLEDGVAETLCCCGVRQRRALRPAFSSFTRLRMGRAEVGLGRRKPYLTARACGGALRSVRIWISISFCIQYGDVDPISTGIRYLNDERLVSLH